MPKHKKHKKAIDRKGILKFVVVFLLILVLTIGVPIIINEAYKCNSGYITMWGASDVLSYYGTLLGSVITVATLAVTILFTRQQIQRESYLNNQKEKWAKIEAVIARALDEINPIPLIKETIEAGQESAHNAITIFQKYQMNCQTVTDNLLACLSSEDYPKVKALIDKMIELSNDYVHLMDAAIKAYQKFNDLELRKTSERMLEIASQIPTSLTCKEIEDCKEVLQDTNSLTVDSIYKEIGQANEKIIQAYENTYRPLLQLKGSTFDAIYKEVQEKADRMLHFRRKKECQHLNGSEKKK